LSRRRTTPLHTSIHHLALELAEALLVAFRAAPLEELAGSGDQANAVRLERKERGFNTHSVEHGARGSEASRSLAALSGRQRDIFERVLHGASTASLARELGISAKTVETHRAKLYRKLDLHSKGDLVRFGAAHGLLKSPRDGRPRESSARARRAGARALATLTVRQRDIFDRIIAGATNKGLARALGISLKTVQTHRVSVNAKLGVHSPSELIRFALANGLLDPR
jgi:DNA-binding CsgD family transcriptional regulator